MLTLLVEVDNNVCFIVFYCENEQSLEQPMERLNILIIMMLTHVPVEWLNSLLPAWWWWENWVNFGLGNGFLPGGTKVYMN